MIRHQAIGGDAKARGCLRFGQNLLERGVVGGLLEQWQTADTTIQHMIGKIASSKTRAAWHADCLREGDADVNKRPFLLLA